MDQTGLEFEETDRLINGLREYTSPDTPLFIEIHEASEIEWPVDLFMIGLESTVRFSGIIPFFMLFYVCIGIVVMN